MEISLSGISKGNWFLSLAVRAKDLVNLTSEINACSLRAMITAEIVGVSVRIGRRFVPIQVEPENSGLHTVITKVPRSAYQV